MAFLVQILFLFQLSAHAEYRVFVLKITKTPQTTRDPASTAESAPLTEPPSERIVLSTLDPEQFVGYYPLDKDETIKYTETWRCYGRTSEFQPLCPNPKAKANP